MTADVPPLEGGGTASASGTTAPTTAPSANRPEYFTPSTAPQAEAEPAGNNSILILGGLAGVVAAAGVLVALAVRRRRRF